MSKFINYAEKLTRIYTKIYIEKSERYKEILRVCHPTPFKDLFKSFVRDITYPLKVLSRVKKELFPSKSIATFRKFIKTLIKK